MQSQKLSLSLRVFLLASVLVLCTCAAFAQDKSSATDGSPASQKQNSSNAKKQTPAAISKDAEASEASEKKWDDEDGPDQIRKRDEWFYKQRSSVNGHIPAGAHFKAFQHMQRMMEAEGKLVRLPDGSYAAVAPEAAVTSQSVVTSSWVPIGPTPTTGGFFSPVTGRITTIAVDPSDSTGNTVLIGAADGGIWRTTDGGSTWTPVGDQNASLAMGSIAFAPSSPATVYAGTGEQASIGFDIYYGAGVLKSSDHGQTWTETCTIASPTCPFIGPYLDSLFPGFGFFNFGGAHISYVAVNPSNSNMVMVGAQFIVEGPKEGVYCSDNGGTTWTNILPDEMSTFVGFASSTVAYAALGNPFGSSPGAPNGNGVYKATGIGATCSTIHFARLTSATLPSQSTMGRIDLGIAPNDTTGNTIYASIADGSNASVTNLGVFVTTNGGTSWGQTSAPDICQHQCWYDNVVKVDPNSKNIVYLGGSSVSISATFDWVMRSTGGTTGGAFASVLPAAQGPGLPHVDVHAITLFKATSGAFSGKVRAYLGNDGGMWRSDDAEAATVTWTNINNASLTLTQFYPSISMNSSSPSIAFGGTQDNASQNYQGGTSWVDNGLCGDGASTAVDAVIPSTVYIGCATGAPVNASYQNGAVGTFSPAINGIDLADAADFIPPLATDPNNANVVYFGTSRVYQSVDAGNTWVPMSAPLVNSGGDWLTAIAVEPGNPKVVYTGSSGGEIFAQQTVTTDGNSPSAFFQVGGFPIAPRAVTAIAVDPTDPTGNSAYVALSGFSFNGVDPLGATITDVKGHIFKTTNANQAPNATFTDLSCSTNDCSMPAAADLPNIPVNDIALDPDVSGIIYAATDLGVFVGNCSAMPCTWSTLGTGLPRVAVLSLRLHEPSRTLRAATHGRGVWDINLNNFTFNGPHISSISPSFVTSGASGSLSLTVNGSVLAGGVVQWNGSTTNVTTTQVSATQLTASVAASLLAAAGTPQITVLNGGQTSNSLTFSVLAVTPTLTSLNPQSTPVQTPTPTTSVQVQLTGTNFSNNAKVLFNSAQNGVTTKFNSATSLTATLPAALLGSFGSTNDISVLNTPPGGGKSLPVSFRVAAPPPPNDIFANAINITTLTFSDIKDSSGATTESTDPTPPCAQQFTSAQGNAGGHPNGDYNTVWYKFAPIFSANLEVATVSSSYDTVLSIWTGPVGSLVNVACNDDINPGIIIQSHVSNVPLTAGTTYYIMVSSFGPPDPNPIALGGEVVFNFAYNNGQNPPATISSISPTSVASGGASFTLTVNGSGILNGASILWGSPSGNVEVAATVVNSTQVTATIDSGLFVLPGTYPISISNPPPGGGATANTVPFTVTVGTYPVPSISFINPNPVVAGGMGFTMEVVGSNFAPTAVLKVNGAARPATVILTNQLNGQVSASDIASTGSAQITVSNPSPGGGPSAPVALTIIQPNPVPTITSISPPNGPTGFGAHVTINGTNFVNLPSVFFNGTFVGSSFVSSSQLTTDFNIGNLSPGVYPLTVVDPFPGGSATIGFTVTGPPDFTITSTGTTTQTVAAGQTATFTNAISVAAQSGFSSQVNLSCALPVAATATTCAVNPGTFASGSGTASVMVTTMARGLVPPLWPRVRFIFRPQYLPVVLLALLLSALLLRLARTRRQRFAGAIPLAGLVLFLILQTIGCGGGGYSSPPPPPPPSGTPANTYTITVTATSGTLTHTTTLTVVVQ